MLVSQSAMRITNLLAVLVISSMLSGCFSTTVMKDVELNAEKLSKGPKQLPVKNITNFSDGLRCMDDLFLSFGISRGDYVIMAEEIKDKTLKVNAGTRQMMISAISDMTRRSGAIRLIAYGADSGNLISFLGESGSKGVYQDIPAFDIIGSISQFDDSIYKKQADASAELAGTNDGSTIGGGGGKSSSSSVTFMTLDLGIVTAHNLALLPGVSTRNSMSLFNKGSASSYDAGISKTGISYSFSDDTKDAVGQSLRGLIELSTIELIGKLVKIPYWNCLGMDPSHEDIRNEVSDWYFQLSQTGILHRTIKIQLALRGLYKGAIDENITENYLQAVMSLKQALGLPLTSDVDLQFYSEFLNRVKVSIAPELRAYSKKLAKPSTAIKKVNSKKPKSSARSKLEPKVINKPMALNISSDTDLEGVAVGDNISLTIEANEDGYLSCYFQREDTMVRIFPNRFSDKGFLLASESMTLPNNKAFSLKVDEMLEEVHCFLTPASITPEVIASQLPNELKVADFEAISGITTDQVRSAYQRAAKNQFAYNHVQFNGVQ